jgi:hypothetical protein
METSTGKSNYQMIPFTRKLAHPFSTPPARYQVTQRSNFGLNILAYAIVLKMQRLHEKMHQKTHQNCLKIAVLRVHLSHVNPLMVVNGCERRRTMTLRLDPTRVKTSW